MHTSIKWLVAASAAMAGIVGAQTTTTPQPQSGRTLGEASRDVANDVGRAASAAVTPGDQDMGRNPNNRSGGLMGTERNGTSATNAAGRAGAAAVTPGDQNMGRNPDNRSGGLMGDNRSSESSTTVRRTARADRG